MTSADIKSFRDKYDLSQSDLAKITGVTQRAVQSWEQGERNIPQSGILLINYYKKAKNEDGNINAKDYKLIPVYNLDAVGGNNNSEVDIASYIIDYIPFKNAKEDDISVPVTNDSMHPMYPSGCFVQIREIIDWRSYLEFGQVYVIELKDGRRLIKQIRKGFDKFHFTLKSFNSEYDDSDIEIELISCIWLVLSKYQKSVM